MTLSPQQQAAVDSDTSLIVCEAVPGAGKTRVLVERILRLLRDGIPASDIAAVTYTKRAAEEMQARLTRAGASQLAHVGTLHQLCLGILRENHALIGFPARLSVVDDTLKEQVLAEAVAEMAYKGTRKELDAMLKLGPFKLQTRIPPKVMLAAKAYFAKMQEAGMLDFDMVLTCTEEALKRGAGHGYGHVLVDEAQDMNGVDGAIYKLLGAHLFLVADPRQAIFGFRGSDIETLRQYQAAARSGLGELLPLTGSYRCGHAIMAAANALIAHDEVPHEPATSLAGYEGKVIATGFETDEAEGAAVAQMILANCTETASYDEVAVLVRYNVLADRFAGILRAHGIPVASRKQTELPGDWGKAAAIVAFLDNPANDRLALAYIEASQGLDQAAVAKRAAVESMCGVYEVCPSLTYYSSIDNIPSVLARCRISSESCELVASLSRGCRSVSDVLLAMHEARYSTEPVGHGVHVLTMHSAKGLEFDTVICSAFEDAVLPATEPENRRLAYVAMTRARQQLVLTWAHQRQPLYGGWRAVAAAPCRFVAEAGI